MVQLCRKSLLGGKNKGMVTWPDSIENAFLAIYYGGGYEEVIETFARRWGSLAVKTFEHVLDVGESEDKLIALFALGYSGTQEARARLVPFLESPHPMERWASALCLGEMQDERAFPVLIDMLQETFPSQGSVAEKRQGSDEDEGWYRYHQLRVPYLLGRWGRPWIVPLIRQTLLKSWEGEQQEVPAPFWRLRYQEALATALGQLGVFGALTDLAVSQERLRHLIVHVAYGSYLAQKGTPPQYLATTMRLNQELQATVVVLLAQQFGLSHEEQNIYIQQVAPSISVSSSPPALQSVQFAQFHPALPKEDNHDKGETEFLHNGRHIELLRRGVPFWNQWKEQHPDIKVRLVGEDLSGMDLREADLSRADLSEANLSGANLSGAELNEATLKWANVRRGQFQDANCSFVDLSGADLHEANFYQAHLASANLSGANLRGANLQDANILYAHFQNAHLHGACLRGADITMSYLTRAILKKADLCGANLELADLSGADMSEADLSSAILRRADLSGANFALANLSGADLTDAKVHGASFRRANLSGATLNGTNLYEAHSD